MFAINSAILQTTTTEVHVTVAHSPQPGQVLEQALRLPAGATLQDALAATGLGFTSVRDVGVWGRSVPLVQRLQGGDRVEVYRPLRVDPKHARRERFARQGARTAGLFQRPRPLGQGS